MDSTHIWCPVCEWQPEPSDTWVCNPGCGHHWHTFKTRGQCPECHKQWPWTTCHQCHDRVPHEAWYHTTLPQQRDAPDPDRGVTHSTKVLSSFSAFHEILRDKTCPHFVFRGVAKYEHTLVPKVGRMPPTPTTKAQERAFYARERTLFEFFRARAFQHVASHHDLSEWHWLTTAQHYGLPTRLLDWTESPLVALFFTLDHNSDSEDGALYFLHVDSLITAYDGSPFANDHHGAFLAPAMTQRITAQAGLFTVHPRPWEPFSDSEHSVVKMRVSPEFKGELRRMLPRYGISRRTLMADLDSTAADLQTLFVDRMCPSRKDLHAGPRPDGGGLLI